MGVTQPNSLNTFRVFPPALVVVVVVLFQRVGPCVRSTRRNNMHGVDMHQSVHVVLYRSQIAEKHHETCCECVNINL